jgi:integrase/recombinase XerD
MATRQPALSLSGAIEGHLRHVAASMSVNTLNDYRRTHAQFLAFLGDVPFAEVATGDVERFLLHMRESPIQPAGVAAGVGAQPRYRRPKTLVNIHTALSALWTWGVKRGYVAEHVVQAVPRPRHNPEPIVPLTETQVARLIRACNESRPWQNAPLTTNHRPSGPRDKAIIGLLVETALRVSELCHLTIGDVAFYRGGGSVRVDLGKGNKSRVVPFSRRCAGLLSDYLSTRPGADGADALFVNVGRNEGLPMTRGSVLKLVTRLGEKAGLRVSPHRLRTTGACLMAKNGASAWQLQQIMGHTEISTTMRYVRAASLDLDEAMRKASPLDNLRL